MQWRFGSLGREFARPCAPVLANWLDTLRRASPEVLYPFRPPYLLHLGKERALVADDTDEREVARARGGLLPQSVLQPRDRLSPDSCFVLANTASRSARASFPAGVLPIGRQTRQET
jgi:hypothetical protein